MILNSLMMPIQSECGFQYLRAIANPFADFGGEFPCIPTTSRASQKIRSFLRGNFFIGQQGVGGVAFWPHRMLFSNLNTAGNLTARCVQSTLAAYNFPDFGFLNSSAYNGGIEIGTVNQTGNSIYNTQAFNPAIEDRSARLVGCGIRVRTSGRLADTNGDMICYRNQNATSTVNANQDTIAQLSQVQTTTWDPVTISGWSQVTYRPVVEDDLQWTVSPADADFSQANITRTQRLAGGIFVQGTPGDRFTFEVVAYFEVSGSRIPETNNHANPADTQKILSACNNSGSSGPGVVAQAMSIARALLEENVVPGKFAAAFARKAMLKMLGEDMPSNTNPTAKIYENTILSNGAQRP